jgi:hypothetical protein
VRGRIGFEGGPELAERVAQSQLGAQTESLLSILGTIVTYDDRIELLAPIFGLKTDKEVSQLILKIVHQVEIGVIFINPEQLIDPHALKLPFPLRARPLTSKLLINLPQPTILPIL